MGLSIHVSVKAQEVIDELDFWDNVLQQREGLRILSELDPDKELSVYPGSYAGLHVVRVQYALLRGWATDGYHVEINDQTRGSHLINHSDCEGWYLPEDFVEPQWLATGKTYSVSLGSSDRLLSELCEMLASKDKWSERCQHSWDAVFIAALASVVTRNAIKFH